MSFLNTPEFEAIYNKLPETGISTGKFAALTADLEFQEILKPHFDRINLINCRNLDTTKNSSQPTSKPEIIPIELYSGPAGLKLAQEGKKVTVLVFADSTNVGGIYMTGGSPANTQEEQTILMAPEIYGYIGNNYGVHDIGGNGDGIYKPNQKRYSLNKEDYKNPEIINPAYGFILTNLLVTHDVDHCSSMIKLPKDKVVEISYAFLSMPSFATSVSRDPVGALLIGQSEENDGEIIYKNMSQAYNKLNSSSDIRKGNWDEMRRDIGKISIFYSSKKVKEFSKKYLEKDDNDNDNTIGSIIYEIVKYKYMLGHEKKLKKELNIQDFPSFKKDVESIVNEARQSYNECLLNKFTNLIKGTEESGSDTLILGKIGCGAFLNNEDEVAELMGKSLSECRTIKYIYFAGLVKSDPFIKKVKKFIGKK